MKYTALFIAISSIPMWAFANTPTTQEQATELSEILVESEKIKHTITPGKTTEEVNNTIPIQDLFADNLGVDFETGSAGMLSDPIIRGIGGSANAFGVGGGRVITTIDGVQTGISSLRFGHHGTGTYIGSNFFDTSNLKNLTISKGATVDESNVGLGGIVAVRTIDVEDVLRHNRPLGLTLRWGYDGRYRDRLLGATGAWQLNEQFSTLLSFNKRYSHERQYSDKVLSQEERKLFRRYNSDSDDWLAKINWQINPNHQIRFSGSYYENKNNGSEKYSSPAATSPDLPQLTLTKRHALTLAGKHNIHLPIADEWEWLINSQSMSTHQIIDGIKTQGFAKLDTYTKQTLSSENQYTRFTFKKLWSTQTTEHELHYGIDYKKGKLVNLNNSRTSVKIHLPNGTVQDGGSSSRESRRLPDINSKDFKVFLTDKISLIDKGITIVPSLNWHISSKTPDLNTISQATRSSDYYSADAEKKVHQKGLSFGLLTHWQINPKHSLALNLAQATRIPEALETHAFQYGHWPKVSTTTLKPEYSQTASLEWQTNQKWFNQSITLSHSRIKNFIDYDYLDPAKGTSTPACDAILAQTYDDSCVGIYNRNGLTVINTLEYDASLDFGWLHQNLKGLKLSTALAWTKGKTKDNNQPLLYAAPLEARATLSYHRNKWDIFVRGTFMKGKKASDLNTHDPFGGSIADAIAGYGVLDAGININPTDALKISIQGHNLLNKKYLRWSDAATAPKTNAYKEFYQPKRSIALNIQYQF